MFIVPVTRDVRQFSRLFDDAFDRLLGPSSDSPAARSPALDVAESERAYTVKVELPGVTKEDVKVHIEGRQVSVQAQVQSSQERQEGERVVYRERSLASYARSFTLGTEVDQAEAGAKLEHGVLTLILPKRNTRATAQITVN